MPKKIARVFPTRTKATPDDGLSFSGPPELFMPEIDEVHISIAFTWWLPKVDPSEYVDFLHKQWSRIAPVKIGGPAFGKPSSTFTPGLYLKKGCVITSRGCHNKCWFCSVWKREPKLLELPIHSGYNLMDDNLLACSEGHIRSVFKMLKQQKQPIEFTGGLEAALLKPWHIDLLLSIKIHQMFFAYDEERDLEPLVSASKMLLEAGFDRQKMRCYCLIGYKGDTFEKAEKRLNTTLRLGFFPYAMLWRNKKGEVEKKWTKFQRNWLRPALISHKLKELKDED